MSSEKRSSHHLYSRFCSCQPFREALTELSERTGLTMANLSILKTGKARTIRFTTLTVICDALSCELAIFSPSVSEMAH